MACQTDGNSQEPRRKETAPEWNVGNPTGTYFSSTRLQNVRNLINKSPRLPTGENAQAIGDGRHAPQSSRPDNYLDVLRSRPIREIKQKRNQCLERLGEGQKMLRPLIDRASLLCKMIDVKTTSQIRLDNYMAQFQAKGSAG
jgi:hypothetical protein